MKIQLAPKRVSTVLLACVFFIVLANLVGIFFNIGLGRDNVFGLVPLFDMNVESNIPTLFSSLIFIIIACLLALISYLEKNQGSHYRYWLGLVFVFLFLSIDESAQIHEMLSYPMRNALNTSGIFFYAWVIPYGISIIIFALVYLRFLLALPGKYKKLFILSGVIFLTGAIGFEMLGSIQDISHGVKNFTYSGLYTAEETFEMLGLVLFIYSLLSWIKDNYGVLELSVSESE